MGNPATINALAQELREHADSSNEIPQHGNPQAWLNLYREAADEIERLRAIVDKLPKCWRLDEDGKLVQDAPVVPGVEAWLMVGKMIRRESV